MERSASSPTTRLAGASATLHIGTIPAPVRRVARQCVLDWIGVALAARHEPLVETLLADAQEDGGAAQATLVGRTVRLSRLQAATINGAAGHALDYDDSCRAMNGHPTATLLPALLALADGEEVSGARMLEAFVAGYETACRIGLLVNPAHYAAGFHATATLGTLGAAAACARLMALDAATTATALGIAASCASGLRANVGTMCKPLHAGLASRDGLWSALLARRGFTALPDILEADHGFAHAHGSEFRLDEALATPPGGFHLPDNLFNYHAACHGTHGAIEATRRLMAKGGFTPQRLRGVVVTLPRWLASVCCIDDPRDGLEAKFSVRATVAMVLAGIDTARPGAFDAGAIRSASVQALLTCISVQFSNVPAPSAATDVELRLDGEPPRTARHDPALPETDLDLQQQRLVAKFSALAMPAVGEARAARLRALVDDLETLPSIQPMLALVGRAGRTQATDADGDGQIVGMDDSGPPARP